MLPGDLVENSWSLHSNRSKHVNKQYQHNLMMTFADVWAMSSGSTGEGAANSAQGS